MVDQFGRCDKPDKDNPNLKCGHPLPCPYHTVLINQKTGYVLYPDKAPTDEKTKQRIRDIADALKNL